MNSEIGRTLLIIGVVIVIMGLLFTFLPKGAGIPKLPGDIYIKRDNFTFYFPVATSIIVSIALSILFYFLNRR